MLGTAPCIKALAAGVPVVAIPLGRDQLDNAARVAHHGAGLRLKPTAKPDAIAKAVRRLLEEPSFSAAAERHGRCDRGGDRRGSRRRGTRGACVARLGRCR